MEKRFGVMSPDQPCICGKDKTFGKCCGAFLSKEERPVGLLTVEAGDKNHFMIGCIVKDEVHTDDDGNVLVFTSRAQALALQESLHAKHPTYGVVGMTDKTWARFQKDVPNHVIVPHAVC